MGIEHIYHDGRQWIFNGGDVMVRVFSPDYTYQGTWIKTPHQQTLTDYWGQCPSRYVNVEQVLAEH